MCISICKQTVTNNFYNISRTWCLFNHVRYVGSLLLHRCCLGHQSITLRSVPLISTEPLYLNSPVDLLCSSPNYILSWWLLLSCKTSCFHFYRPSPPQSSSAAPPMLVFFIFFACHPDSQYSIYCCLSLQALMWGGIPCILYRTIHFFF